MIPVYPLTVMGLCVLLYCVVQFYHPVYPQNQRRKETIVATLIFGILIFLFYTAAQSGLIPWPPANW